MGVSSLDFDLKGAHLLCQVELLRKSFLEKAKCVIWVREEKVKVQAEEDGVRLGCQLLLAQTTLTQHSHPNSDRLHCCCI